LRKGPRCATRDALVEPKAISLGEMSLARELEKGHNSAEERPAHSAEEPAMAFNLKLPAVLAKMRWKVKIRDKERVEDPHFTIIFGTRTWRVCLRDGRFMDGGSWKDVPDDLRDIVRDNWDRLCSAWDEMYPHNPVQGSEDHDDGGKD
jgi:hypothetical protein